MEKKISELEIPRMILNELMFNDIIEGFNELTLEEKVDKLIHIYATEKVYEKRY